MFEWVEVRWVVTAAAIGIFIILLDEYGYYWWKKRNPGALYSHLYDRTITPLNPSQPPTRINE